MNTTSLKRSADFTQLSPCSVRYHLKTSIQTNNTSLVVKISIEKKQTVSTLNEMLYSKKIDLEDLLTNKNIKLREIP